MRRLCATLCAIPLWAASAARPAEFVQADVWLHSNEESKALEAYQRIAERHPSDPYVWVRIAVAARALRQHELAARSFERVVAFGLNGHYATSYNAMLGAAGSYAQLGDRDKAFAWLTKLVDTGSAWVFDLQNRAALASLREDSRYAAILAKAQANVRAQAGQPAWSPDSKRIAFVVVDTGRTYLALMNRDGSGLRRMTDDGLSVRTPSWSSDGKRILFACDKGSASRAQICNISADGGKPTVLVPELFGVSGPRWSMDESRIVFASVVEGKSRISTMRADGADRREVTSGTANDSQPSWSPDGRQILFQSDRDGFPAIYVMNADGSSPARLAPGANPRFSPDGRQIYFEFSVARHGTSMMERDGSGLHSVFQSPWHDMSSVSPDGKRMVFSSDQTGINEIYVARRDGSRAARLTRVSEAGHTK